MTFAYHEITQTSYPDGTKKDGRERWVYKTDPQTRRRPLPYRMRETRADVRLQTKDGEITRYVGGLGATAGTDLNGLPDWAQPCVNQAYERFRNEALGDTSSLGVFAAEMKESVGMINQRVLSLYKAYRSIRKGDLRECLDELSAPMLKRHRRLNRKEVARRSGSLWLEYWFGWSPFTEDVTGLAHNLSQPLPAASKAKGSARDNHREIVRDWDGVRIDRFQVVRIKMGATVSVVNPNTFLAARLGLANPGTVAWELVPFSFLADWAFDVSSFLDSFTDFVGCDVTDPYSVTHMRTVEEFTPWHPVWGPGGGTISSVWMKRGTGIMRPVPNLQVSANIGKSLTRAASTASLLSQLWAGSSGSRRRRRPMTETI